jgi:hypothetical protein
MKNTGSENAVVKYYVSVSTIYHTWTTEFQTVVLFQATSALLRHQSADSKQETKERDLFKRIIRSYQPRQSSI